MWFPEGPERGSRAGGWTANVGSLSRFQPEKGRWEVGTAKTPTTLLAAGPALHLSLHSSLARSALPLALGRGQAFSQNRITQVPRLPHPRLWGFHSPGLTKDSFNQPSTPLPLSWPWPHQPSHPKRWRWLRLQNPRAFLPCPCGLHSLFSDEQRGKLNYVADSYSSRISGCARETELDRSSVLGSGAGFRGTRGWSGIKAGTLEYSGRGTGKGMLRFPSLGG